MQAPEIDHVLVDIDDTLTGDKPGVSQINANAINHNALFEELRNQLVEGGASPDAAKTMLLDYVRDHVFWDYSEIIRDLGLPEDQTWARLASWQDRNLRVFEDGVDMVRRLHQRGLNLSICSNNPLSGCLLKLQHAGLGDLSGTPYFTRIYASNSLMGQKNAPHWWPRLMEDLAVSPERVVIVGDNPRDDCAVPRHAGFKHFILVDRAQTEACRFDGDVIHVRSLVRVPDLIAATGGGVTDAAPAAPAPVPSALTV